MYALLTIGSLRLARTKPGQRLVDALAEPVPRKLRDHGDVLALGDAERGAREVHPDALAHDADLGLLVREDGVGRVQGDGVPDQLGAAVVPWLLRRWWVSGYEVVMVFIAAAVAMVMLQELARGDGAVDLEAAVGADQRGVGGLVPSEIVQEGRNGMDFDIKFLWGIIDRGGGIGPGPVVASLLLLHLVLPDQSTEKPATHNMVVNKVARMLAGIDMGGADDGGVNDGDPGDGAVGIGGCMIMANSIA